MKAMLLFMPGVGGCAENSIDKKWLDKIFKAAILNILLFKGGSNKAIWLYFIVMIMVIIINCVLQMTSFLC